MPSATLQPQPAETTQPQRCTFYVYCMQKNDPTGKHSGSPRFLGITTFYLLRGGVLAINPPLLSQQHLGDCRDPCASGPYTLTITLSSSHDQAALGSRDS